MNNNAEVLCNTIGKSTEGVGNLEAPKLNQKLWDEIMSLRAGIDYLQNNMNQMTRHYEKLVNSVQVSQRKLGTKFEELTKRILIGE